MPFAPPPSSVPSTGMSGQSPTGPDNGVPGQATTAPIPAPDPSTQATMQLIVTIVMSSRKLADAHPELIPEVRAINDQCQMIQRKLVASLPPSNVPGPPV